MTTNHDAETFPTKSGPGEIWVCPACGRRNKDRYGLGDTSCVINAVLCLESSLVFDGDRLVNAQAIGKVDEVTITTEIADASE